MAPQRPPKLYGSRPSRPAPREEPIDMGQRWGWLHVAGNMSVCLMIVLMGVMLAYIFTHICAF